MTVASPSPLVDPASLRRLTGALERLRARARRLLVLREVTRVAASVLIVTLALVLLDYLLRLPGPLRLAMGLVMLGATLTAMTIGVRRAMGFHPDLSVLALRAERVYPSLAGLLASGVDFSLHPDDWVRSPISSALARQSIARAQAELDHAPIARLLDPAPTLRAVMLAVGVAFFAGLMAIAWPQAANVAAQRWITPLASIDWPRRTQIDALTADGVWPADRPFRAVAVVHEGYRDGMRAWVHWRMVGVDGQASPWSHELLNAQPHAEGAALPATGRFERLLDLTPRLTPADRNGRRGRLELWFEAGDNRTTVQRVDLIDRPAVREVRMRFSPPAYAVGLVNAQTASFGATGLTGRHVAATQALRGSLVTLDIEINKPLPQSALTLDQLLPDLLHPPAAIAGRSPAASPDHAAPLEPEDVRIDVTAASIPSGNGAAANADADPPTITVTFPLQSTVQTTLRLRDQHGLDDLSEQVYRIEAVPDQPPSVTLITPRADEAVLKTAVAPMEAAARDDWGVERLDLVVGVLKRGASLPTAAAPSEPAPNGASDRADEPSLDALFTQSGRSRELSLRGELAVADLSVEPGDEVLIAGEAQDIYVGPGGVRHATVRSAIRRLRIIEAGELVKQLRRDLTQVRRQAIRVERDQAAVQERDAAEAVDPQEAITRRLTAQATLVDQLRDRLNRNVGDASPDQPLEQTGEVLERAATLLDQASEASQAAREGLEASRDAANDPNAADEDAAAEQASSSRAEAEQQQEAVREALSGLVSLLDEGRDAIALQLEVQQLRAEQRDLSQQVRELLPRTAGRSLDELSQPEREALDRARDEQAALAERARRLSMRMQSAAGEMAQEGASPDQLASAEVLSEAARIAQEQGLSEQMDQAASETGENRLSQSSQSQNAALETLEAMLERFEAQSRRRQEILQRQMQALRDAIQSLIDRQDEQLDVLRVAEAIAPLQEPMLTLRRNTMAVEQDATASPATQSTADELGRAVTAQGRSINSMRGEDQQASLVAGQAALSHLTTARDLLDQARAEQQADEMREARDALRSAYLKLAAEQDELFTQAQPLIDRDIPRAQRRAVLEMASRQREIRTQAGELRDQVTQRTVYQHTHDQIDRLADRSVEGLSRAQIDQAIARAQQRTSQLLRMLAQAMDRGEQEDDPFNSPQAGGGGEGGSGEGSPPSPAPPLADLKLLYALQSDLLERTRGAAADADADNDPTRRDREAMTLAGEQMDLASLGDRLLETLQAAADRRPDAEPPNPDGMVPPQPPVQDPGDAIDVPPVSPPLTPEQGR